MSNTIRQHFFYAYPPQDVWAFLTKAELIAQWLMPNDFEPVVGHKFQFTTKAMPQIKCDGIFLCEVLEIIPLKKLSYSWKAGPGDGSINLDTIVTWTLHAGDNGTDLELVHTGFDENKNLDIYKGMIKGWQDNLEKMDKKIKISKDATSNT